MPTRIRPSATRRLALQGAVALGAVTAAAPHLAASARTAPVDGASDGGGNEDPNLRQTVTDQEEHVHGEKVVLDVGHVDLGPRLRDGQWTLHARDDAQSPPVWRDLEDVVLQVHDAGAIQLPGGEDYAFTTAQPGDRVWAVPQVEVPGVVWLGWNTQDPEVVKAATRGVYLRFHAVQGPGALSLFLQPGTFDPPQVLVDPKEEQPQDIFIEPNTHTHVNWVFTEPGVYLVDLEAFAELPDGRTLTDARTLRFAVGDRTSTEEALMTTWSEAPGPEERQAAAEASDAGGDTSDASPTSSTDSTDDAASAVDGEAGPMVSPGLLVGGGAAALAVAGIGATAAVQRSRRRRLEGDVWADDNTESTDRPA